MKSNGRKRVVVSLLLMIFIYSFLRNFTVSEFDTREDASSTTSSTLSSATCSVRDRMEILHSVLPMNDKGEVFFCTEKVSRCLIIDETKPGVYRFMDERNFKGVTCNATTKRFLEDGEMPTTILQSFPGSGNTWTRHLIEEMTGFYTGSVYRDPTLKAAFPGEKITSNVVVVKSHKRYEEMDFKFNKVILLIRKPYETLLSFFSWYKTKTHTGFDYKENFDREEFVRFFKSKANLYRGSYTKWLENYKGKLLIQFYNDLKTDLLNSLTRIASFLGTEVTLSKLWCLNKAQKGSFKRGEKPKWFKKATELDQELEYIVTQVEATVLDACEKRMYGTLQTR